MWNPSGVRSPVTKAAISLVDVGGEQGGAVGIGPGHDQGRHIHHVGGETRRLQGSNVLRGRHQDLAPHVAAFLLCRQLVFVMDTGGAGLDEPLGELEDVERAAEPGLAVGDDGDEPVDVGLSLRPVDLVGATKCIVDPLDECRGGIGGVQRLIGVDVAGQVPVRRHLPSGEVDRLQTGLHHLHRLATAEGPQCADVVLGGQTLPECDRHPIRQRGLLPDAAPEPHHVFCAVVPGDALPARVGLPVVGQTAGLVGDVRHVSLPQLINS